MAINNRNSSINAFPTSSLRRVSWATIFGGALFIIVMDILFGFIGLSLGLGSINPVSEQNPVQGLGTGMIIWIGVTTLLVLFGGGWIASRLSGVPGKFEGTMH